MADMHVPNFFIGPICFVDSLGDVVEDCAHGVINDLPPMLLVFLLLSLVVVRPVVA